MMCIETALNHFLNCTCYGTNPDCYSTYESDVHQNRFKPLSCTCYGTNPGCYSTYESDVHQNRFKPLPCLCLKRTNTKSTTCCVHVMRQIQAVLHIKSVSLQIQNRLDVVRSDSLRFLVWPERGIRRCVILTLKCETYPNFQINSHGSRFPQTNFHGSI